MDGVGLVPATTASMKAVSSRRRASAPVALLENLKQRGSVVAAPTLVFEAGTDFSGALEKSS